ncbi:polymorphic outer membrane protein repeat-containing protein/parallel beta-helix repeat (two copies) [Methanobrevibacter gottschalkii]|uniref:Polymorphic outer membrane protein repeat-containing protein/parallel beta-helix repeat (Two copies) n=1 Tax=Methanobrevibacter gottschalkii TaxID=190974 RepID=A0A1H7MFL0_9EURY|nr:right-handed parallel beta-helix repeat-containing protein [Methanobrevibacter gottschalkii]SEL09934.1 polymorphic outer membrane protein repeat-containing protein/parallel beta-helix repeat (two copies) [Methanobrevibacter gottschalkii]
MGKSFKFSLILLAVFVVIGSLNMVSAFDDLSAEVLDNSSLSSGNLEDIVSVNDNIVYVSNHGNDEKGNGSINSPYASLSQAINKSGNGYIIFMNGSFSGEKNCNLLIDKNLSITSFGLSYINGDSKSRIFNVLENCTLSVSNLSFSSSDVSNLNNSNGGAIYSEGILIISRCEFNYCTANNGGAIYSKGQLILNNSRFNKNRAIAYGGAIYCSSDNSLVNNSIFKENCAKSKITEVSGGAISNFGNNFTVSCSLFEGNFAKETSKVKNDPIYGGAISNYGNGFHVYGCEFMSNYVEVRTDAGSGEVCLNIAEGGAIYTVACAKVENCHFDKDTAHCRYSSNQINIYGNKCYGGAISVASGKGFYLLNNTFTNCSSANGVVKNNANYVLFENNTFDNNKAMFMGSSIYDNGENNIYRGNTFLNNNDPKNHAQGTVYVNACNVTFENNAFLNNYDTSNSVHSSNNAAIYIYNPTFREGSDAGDTNIKISNNNFDGNDRGIYLYCSGGAKISNNKFTNQRQQAINTYVGRDLSILDNYFYNNHGYHGAVSINSRNTLIKGNTFANNSGSAAGAIGLLCRDDVKIDSNTFIGNHATYGGGDIYSIYSNMMVTNNNFVIYPIYEGESSIYTKYGKIDAINNKFTISDNLHKIIKQIGQIEYFLNNVIYDNTPVNDDGSISSSSVEDLIDLHKRTKDDFTYYRNATENNVNLDDNSSSNDSGNGESNNMEDVIDDIVDDIKNIFDDINVVIDNIEGSGDASYNGSSVSSGGIVNSSGLITNSSSDVGKYHEIDKDQSLEVSSQSDIASANDMSSEELSRSIAYDLLEKKPDNSNNSVMNQFVILIVILALLLIYGFYRGRKDI